MRLILLFVVVPLLELFLLLQLAEWTSGSFTFALVLLTGIVGATLARRQGWQVISRLQNELNRGELPTTTLLDALMIFVAGALLITPGVLTDVVGFSLLVPAARRAYRTLLIRWFRQHATVVARGQHDGHRPTNDPNTIDAVVVSRGESHNDRASLQDPSQRRNG